MRRFAFIAAFSLLWLALGSGSGVSAQSASVEGPAVYFLVDTSGSMQGSKIAEAKAALRAVGPSVSSGTNVGLRSFAGSCESPGSLRVPIGPYEDVEFQSAVDNLSAFGGTPTSAALRRAVLDFPDDATSRTLVLIADGDDQCGDLCLTVQDLVAQGVDVTIQAVGIQVGGSAEAALTCAANASGGDYFGVDDLADLTDAIGNAVDGEYRWVAMGDSYSSGEGAFTFDPGTNVKDVNECRRSFAYSRVALRSLDSLVDEFDFVACSGARSYHVTTEHQYKDDDPETLDQLIQIEYLDGTEDLITISIGGNDVGFGDIIAACTGALGPKFVFDDSIDYELEWILDFAQVGNPQDYAALAKNCESYSHRTVGSFSEFVESGIDAVESDVVSVLSEIQRKAPGARVLVVGYPQFLPGENLPTCETLVGLDGEERTWARSLVTQLNHIVERSATSVGYEYVDIEQQFERFTAQDSRANGADDGKSHLICSDTGADFANGIIPPELGINNSFHPNLLGHEEVGAFVLACILDGSSCNPPTPELLCNGQPATIYGTDGPDAIRGLVGPDVIVTLGGDDEVAAKGDIGDDTICGGSGNDKLSGGDGNDFISGGPGNDLIKGDEGDDLIFGDSGDDELHGKNGNDRIFGGDDDDELHGGRSNGDFCDGGGGTDEAPRGPIWSRSGCNEKVNIP